MGRFAKSSQSYHHSFQDEKLTTAFDTVMKAVQKIGITNLSFIKDVKEGGEHTGIGGVITINPNARFEEEEVPALAYYNERFANLKVEPQRLHFEGGHTREGVIAHEVGHLLDDKFPQLRQVFVDTNNKMHDETHLEQYANEISFASILNIEQEEDLGIVGSEFFAETFGCMIINGSNYNTSTKALYKVLQEQGVI